MQFMHEFLEYVEHAQEEHKNLSLELLLEESKEEVFRKMESNTELEALLLDYYQETRSQLPFRIE